MTGNIIAKAEQDIEKHFYSTKLNKADRNIYKQN